VTYGYRRNLFALKWPALALNLTVVACCIVIFMAAPLAPFVGSKSRVIVVLAVAAIHALYIGFGVTRGGLEDAARIYARQLILSCEAFVGKQSKAVAEKKSGARR
jgi:hypothetical protein